MRTEELDPSAELELVYFGLFDNCNVKCNMCDCWSLPRSTQSGAHFTKVLDRVLALRPRAVRFTGGEPLLLRELPDLISRCAALGVRTSVITNGRILPGRLTALVDAGCDEVVLSLDAVGVVHDDIRQFRGLFDRCSEGLSAMAAASIDYGVNTVVQRLNIAGLPDLADLLLTQATPPRWWHLIPVRGDESLQPSSADVALLRQRLPDVRRAAAAVGVELVASEDMFVEAPPSPCSVPSFTLYVRADTGAVYGCNMLVYANPPIGNILTHTPDRVWSGSRAGALRQSCATGRNADCGRCDPASRSMNHVLRGLARANSAE